VLLLVLWAHLTIEPVPHIYRTWADNRVPGGRFEGFANLMGLASPFVGGLAVTLLFVLGIALAVLPFLIWRESDEPRRTAGAAMSAPAHPSG
jgi:hypothetical protein